MTTPVIWTREVRFLLYCELVRRFGKLDTWEKKSSPGNGMDVSYDTFCVAFANIVGAKSSGAVKQQIAFTRPIRDGATHCWCPSLSRQAILNIAAAFDAGFIESRHLPRLLASRQRRR